MLVVRNKQVEVMAEALLEARAAAHARKCFPEEALALGPELNDVIRRSIRRARSHDFSGPDIMQFVDLAVIFGEGFDRLEWARAVLVETRPERRRFRAVRLYEAAIRQLRYRERAGR